MMISTWRRQITASLLRWFSPASGTLGWLAENPQFTHGEPAKNCPHLHNVTAFARRRLPLRETFNRINDPRYPQIPIDGYPS